MLLVGSYQAGSMMTAQAPDASGERRLMIDGMVAGGRCLGGKQSSDHTRTD